MWSCAFVSHSWRVWKLSGRNSRLQGKVQERLFSGGRLRFDASLGERNHRKPQTCHGQDPTRIQPTNGFQRFTLIAGRLYFSFRCVWFWLISRVKIRTYRFFYVESLPFKIRLNKCSSVSIFCCIYLINNKVELQRTNFRLLKSSGNAKSR